LYSFIYLLPFDSHKKSNDNLYNVFINQILKKLAVFQMIREPFLCLMTKNLAVKRVQISSTHSKKAHHFYFQFKQYTFVFAPPFLLILQRLSSLNSFFQFTCLCVTNGNIFHDSRYISDKGKVILLKTSQISFFTRTQTRGVVSCRQSRHFLHFVGAASSPGVISLLGTNHRAESTVALSEIPFASSSLTPSDGRMLLLNKFTASKSNCFSSASF